MGTSYWRVWVLWLKWSLFSSTGVPSGRCYPTLPDGDSGSVPVRSQTGVPCCQNVQTWHWRNVDAAVTLLPRGGCHCQVRHLLFVGLHPGRGGRISVGFCSREVYETGELSPALGTGGRRWTWPCERAGGVNVKQRIGKLLRVVMVSVWLWSFSVKGELCFTSYNLGLLWYLEKALRPNVIPIPVVQRFYSIPGVCLRHAPIQSIAKKSGWKAPNWSWFWEVLFVGACSWENEIVLWFV